MHTTDGPERSLHALTDLQIDVLRSVWRRGEATASEVTTDLESTRGLARKTVGTLLRRLEEYGFLAHRQDGREYLFHAAVEPDEVRKATVSNVMDRLFGGDVPSLLSYALEVAEVAPGDVERIQQLLERSDPGKGQA